MNNKITLFNKEIENKMLNEKLKIEYRNKFRRGISNRKIIW